MDDRKSSIFAGEEIHLTKAKKIGRCRAPFLAYNRGESYKGLYTEIILNFQY